MFWGDDIGYSLNDREKNSLRVQKICTIFEQQGLIVIASIMSIFQEHRDTNRKVYNKYFEVFLDIDLNLLKQRKKIYQLALEGKMQNVVGVDIEYTKPVSYDIKFTKNLDVNYLGDMVLEKLGEVNIV